MYLSPASSLATVNSRRGALAAGSVLELQSEHGCTTVIGGQAEAIRTCWAVKCRAAKAVQAARSRRATVSALPHLNPMQPAIEGLAARARTAHGLQRLEKQHMHAEHSWPGEATRGAASKTKPTKQPQHSRPEVTCCEEPRLQSQLRSCSKTCKLRRSMPPGRRTS